MFDYELGKLLLSKVVALVQDLISLRAYPFYFFVHDVLTRWVKVIF